MKALIMCIALLTPLSVTAEVLSKSMTGFKINIERIVSTDPATTYKQFLSIGEWWIADHTWFGESANLFIDPRAGGCFCEIRGDRQVLHMTVSFVDPNNEIRMIGGLGPLQMMGVHGGMSWKFEAQKNGGTKIIHQYHVSGFSEAGLEWLADIVNNTQQGQVDALVAKLANP